MKDAILQLAENRIISLKCELHTRRELHKLTKPDDIRGLALLTGKLWGLDRAISIINGTDCLCSDIIKKRTQGGIDG